MGVEHMNMLYAALGKLTIDMPAFVISRNQSFIVITGDFNDTNTKQFDAFIQGFLMALEMCEPAYVL